MRGVKRLQTNDRYGRRTVSRARTITTAVSGQVANTNRVRGRITGRVQPTGEVGMGFAGGVGSGKSASIFQERGAGKTSGTARGTKVKTP